MDTRYIILGCFGILALTLCLLSALFTKTEKVKVFIILKGLSTFSYVLLALISINLVYNMSAFSLFVTIGLCAFMFSNIVRAIPTKTDMFRTFYTYIESFGFAFLVTSTFFLIEKPFIGLIIGSCAFIIMMIVYLVMKKSHLKKLKFANLLLLITSLVFSGITINLLCLMFSVQNLLLTIGAVFLSTYVGIQVFSHFQNKTNNITKNIFLGLGLILLALSIFFI